MLIKVRRLGAAFSAPKVEEVNGTFVLNAEMLGELVKLPESLREAGEQIVGELSMSFMPVGIEVQLAATEEKLNGLWVQREIYNALMKQAAVSA